MADWTPERIAELKALCEVATPGPWIDTGAKIALDDDDRTHIGTAKNRDRPFIAAARAALPEALAALEQRTVERDTWEANANEWQRICNEELQPKLKQALAEIEQRDKRIDELLAEVKHYAAGVRHYADELAALRQHALSAAEAERLLRALPCKEEPCECGGYELAQKLAALHAR